QGLLGRVTAFYGCVEAQGRGTLHCHMMVWIDGALNPNEIKERVLADMNGEFQKRLLAVLDDTISNCVPDDPPDVEIPVPSSAHHPCSVRGPDLSAALPQLQPARQLDLRNVVLKSQMHTHSGTCFKYWKGTGPRECRFDLDAANYCPESSFDPETGEINLRCLNGLVNNYNPTMIEALRCNMDIKFIGSGQSAKAILYYVTDYITKSPLKAHVAYAALEMAVRKLNENESAEESDTQLRAKRLLQKCSYAMVSHQELSAQQVASYLTDCEDHFVSHEFRNLYWPGFERHIEKQDPSPECDRNRQDDSELVDNSDSDTASQDDDDDHVVLHEALDEPAEDEVVLTVDDGRIMARSGQLADYICRGVALDALCL
ncbi:hypothetical protein EXIGLDRAFT_591831, partial [Exidia glandulosa HHB12029]